MIPKMGSFVDSRGAKIAMRTKKAMIAVPVTPSLDLKKTLALRLTF